MAGGRPTKCTPEVIEEFAERMKAGHYLEHACALVGIIDDTARNWLKWGKAALAEAGNDLDKVEGENERLYAKFFGEVTRAKAIAVGGNLGCIQKAAQGVDDYAGDWRAAESFLKIRHPKLYGKQEQRHEHTGAGGGPVEVSWWAGIAEIEADDAEDAGGEEGGAGEAS